ncbi:MAG: type II secretion system F family protein [Deltaproteobacteria bacterium]|nr:type II secretion system F family protein [Deltaproteobacteria bacterium]
MPAYIWEGKSKDGSFKKGKITAANESSAYQMLGSQGINVSRLKEKKPFKFSDLSNIDINMGGVPPRDLMIFTRQFSTMIDAGLPLVQALEILGTTSENKQFRKILMDIKERVEGGSTFSEALARHPSTFDNLFVNLVKAGEIGGVLDVIMGRMANHIEKNMKLRRRIKSAMTYPVIVLLVCIVVLGALLFKVIPTFEDMFADMGGKSLPPLTAKIIAMSRWSIAHGNIIFGGLGAIISGFFIFLRIPGGKFMFHKGLLHLPIIGDVIKKSAVAAFTRTMGTLLSSGVPILDALEIVADSSSNLVIRDALMKVRNKISEGRNIVEPLMETKIFPHMVVQMIGVGEQTGALDTMLNKIADFYEDEVDVAVDAMTSAIEPLLMVFLGSTVGTTMIAMYQPVFEMAGAVKQ